MKRKSKKRKIPPDGILAAIIAGLTAIGSTAAKAAPALASMAFGGGAGAGGASGAGTTGLASGGSLAGSGGAGAGMIAAAPVAGAGAMPAGTGAGGLLGGTGGLGMGGGGGVLAGGGGGLGGATGGGGGLMQALQGIPGVSQLGESIGGLGEALGIGGPTGELGQLGAIPELGMGEGVVVTETQAPGLFSAGQMGQIMPGASKAVPVGTEISKALGAGAPVGPPLLQLANQAMRVGMAAKPQGGGGGVRIQPSPRRPRQPTPTSLGPIGGGLLQAATASPQRDFLMRVLMQMGQGGNF